jgi:thioredoxin reductase
MTSSKPSVDFDVSVIGAGPYGLSAASHLTSCGFTVRVFGEPMAFWAHTMPAGMLLRSQRAASTIADPRGAWRLEDYESATATPAQAPVPLSTFVKYGLWFRQQLGDLIDHRNVTRLARRDSGFEVTLADHTRVSSRRVVVATGIGVFRYSPAMFRGLSPKAVSHCYDGRDLRNFAGARVAVIGAGQSALESAALLREHGADVEVIARCRRFRWIGAHMWLRHLGPLSTLMYSKHDVGHAGLSRLVAYPNLLARLPLSLRDWIRIRAIRPAGAIWLAPRLADVKISTGRSVNEVAGLNGHGVRLRLDDGTERVVDHVLLGTGYRIDLTKYDFLSPDLLRQIRQLDGSPALTAGFASSVAGLHFIGATAARSYGPLLCFVTGTEFASRHLTTHLAAN